MENNVGGLVQPVVNSEYLHGFLLISHGQGLVKCAFTMPTWKYVGLSDTTRTDRAMHQIL